MRSRRPGIASANRPRSGSFSSLLDQIMQDDSALDGLVFAYSGLPAVERRALIHAVVQDAKDPTEALLALLAVEEAPSIRNRLAALLGKHAPIERSAFLREAQGRGEAVLLQSLPAQAPEALRVSWNDREIQEIEIESLSDSRFESLRAVSVAEAIDLLAPLLWQRMRSGGDLPTDLSRFAGFFSLG